jgi:hypothetical protein
MKYVVEWEQWYRCGHHGDDKDFEIYRKEFATEVEARQFKLELLNGTHRGFADMKVKDEDVTIFFE